MVVLIIIGDVIENTILRFYVDDENVAAVQYTVDNSIGIGVKKKTLAVLTNYLDLTKIIIFLLSSFP